MGSSSFHDRPVQQTGQAPRSFEVYVTCALTGGDTWSLESLLDLGTPRRRGNGADACRGSPTGRRGISSGARRRTREVVDGGARPSSTSACSPGGGEDLGDARELGGPYGPATAAAAIVRLDGETTNGCFSAERIRLEDDEDQGGGE